jgi:hypothetical protein
VTQAHFRELVVGSALDSTGSAGPWVELSGLAVDRLKGVTSTSIAGAPANLDLGAGSLAKSLKSDVALATDAGWRAEPEFGTAEAVRAALFDTAIGTLSDPFVLDGKLALAIVSERKTAAPDARTLARLTLDGYDAWFGSEYARAKITRSDHPLPELEPSASPSPTAAPALPSAPVLDTPNVPQIPGGPAATPVPTDAMGLPVLP